MQKNNWILKSQKVTKRILLQLKQKVNINEIKNKGKSKRKQ